MSLLEGFRVLDLTNEKGMLSGKILADLGAEVIKIEEPVGDESRNLGPYYKDESHPEKSLSWFDLNRGKKGITLRIETKKGKEILLKLVKTANCLIESFPPGYLEGIGLGTQILFRENPSLVITSITPFGQTGPYKDYKAPDVVAMALGGYTWLNGYPDRTPVSFGVPQAYSLASLQATAATMIASYHSLVTGEGQHVDQSIVESIIWATQETPVAWDLVKWCPVRRGMGRENISGGWLQYLYPCKNGAVSFHVIGGKGGANFMKALTEWMQVEGADCKSLTEMDWVNFDLFFATEEVLGIIQEPIRKFFSTRTKESLYREAINRRIMLFPASTISELLQNEQLNARGFWKTIEHPGLNDNLIYAGTFYRLRETPEIKYVQPPHLGAHNHEIIGKELGYSDKQLNDLKENRII